MRARIFIAGLITIAAACSTPDADPIADPAMDESAASPELALTSPTGAVPVASDVEMHRPEEPAVPGARTPATRVAPDPVPEPIAAAMHEHHAALEPVAAEANVRSLADGADEVADDQGGGKPRGVNTGLGPIPDRNWGGAGVIDEPAPMPGMEDDGVVALPGRGATGTPGPADAVITRGGAGSVVDDCAKHHPRGGLIGSTGTVGGTTVLVNDRDPRRGATISDRAPRTTNRPSLPRGGGFPRGGIR